MQDVPENKRLLHKRCDIFPFPFIHIGEIQNLRIKQYHIVNRIRTLPRDLVQISTVQYTDIPFV